MLRGRRYSVCTHVEHAQVEHMHAATGGASSRTVRQVVEHRFVIICNVPASSETT